jgi:hypothetical protein
MVTVLYESQHSLTTYVFGAVHTTPKGAGPTMEDVFDESGWLIEDVILQGVLGAECVPPIDVRRTPLSRSLLGGRGARRAT